LGGACDASEENNAYSLLVVELEGKRPLGRLRRRWMDDVEMDLGERAWVIGLDWSGSG
jgi:hypothetical protein